MIVDKGNVWGIYLEMIIYRTHTICEALTSELIFISFKFHYNPEE